MLYLGTMEWYPNMQGIVWFIDEVMPLIKKRHPGIRLNIAGFGRPFAELLDHIAGREDIRFLGQQSDERDLLRRSNVYIVPLWIGAGARVKILTAWAAGIPVVATTIGAEGLYYTPGEEILVADDPAGFADHVCRVIEDQDLAINLSGAGRALVEKKYSLDVAVGMYDAAYRELISRSRSGELCHGADYLSEKENTIRSLVALKADIPAILDSDPVRRVIPEKAGGNGLPAARTNPHYDIAWRISRSISGTVAKWFPRGTGRQRCLVLVLIGLTVIHDEGWRSFFNKTGRWIIKKGLRREDLRK